MLSVLPRIEITSDSIIVDGFVFKAHIQYRKAGTRDIEARLERAIALLKDIQRSRCFQEIALLIDDEVMSQDQMEANLYNAIMHAQEVKYQIEDMSNNCSQNTKTSTQIQSA